VEVDVEEQSERDDGEGYERVAAVGEGRHEHDRGEQRRPQPEDHHGPPGAVTHPHEPVMEVFVIRLGERLPAPQAPDEREDGVEDRHSEDHQRDRQGREVEVRLTTERVGGPAPDGDRRRRQQQAEEHRSGVAHEDTSRVEVVREEPDADADGDGRHQRPHVRALEQTRLEQPIGVQEHRRARDHHDAAGQPVEPVDQVDGVRHDDDREHGDERCEVG
jgi:hypothetical protein